MIENIEIADSKRRSCLKGYLTAFYIFMFLWIVRFFFRADDLNDEPIGIVVLLGLILTVLMQAYFMIRLASLKKMINKDPKLSSALNNELVKLYEIKSWKTAFICAVGSTFFFAFLSFVYPVCDLVLVALTSVVVGGGGYMTAFFIMDRA